MVKDIDCEYTAGYFASKHSHSQIKLWCISSPQRARVLLPVTCPWRDRENVNVAWQVGPRDSEGVCAGVGVLIKLGCNSVGWRGLGGQGPARTKPTFSWMCFCVRLVIL